MMLIVVTLLFSVFVKQHVLCEYVFRSLLYENITDPATRQLYEFRKYHPKPIGLLTTSAGEPVDVRDTITLNTDMLDNSYFVDTLLHLDSEVIPERVAHAKGTAAWGYFEVTNDVSKYTKANVFNGIGKKTPIVGRFSTVAQNKGGSDLAREGKGLAIKFYTREGNLDYLCLNFPVFIVKDPEYFKSFIHVMKRNPQTNLVDNTAKIDFFSLRPESLHHILWTLSDYGIPNGYRKMDAFAIHTYEINNKKGEKYFVKFNFRTEQGVENLPSDEAVRISGIDPDYNNRDLYNSIEEKDYPVWKFEMDVLNFTDILNLNYNPFDVTVLWKKGTYHTVEIGKIVFNRNPDNMYRVSELSAFNPANLVPGIPGPFDNLFKSRRLSYADTQKHRLGANYNRIEVNHPTYAKVYNRDGEPPVKDNMNNVPNYYPNSFSGPIPYVETSKPKNKISLLENQAADLQQPAYFYNHVLDDDEQRTRLANNTVQLLRHNPPFLQRRWINLYYMIDYRLGDETSTLLHRALKHINTTITPRKILRVSRDKCY